MNKEEYKRKDKLDEMIEYSIYNNEINKEKLTQKTIKKINQGKKEKVKKKLPTPKNLIERRKKKRKLCRRYKMKGGDARNQKYKGSEKE